MIKLFEHNRIAYNAAVAMLASTGKAAIIHPTGTGKSFIGFKLCEDNPEKTILWLSPSEYIFKTQLEALKKSSGYVPENIEFFTYAKLMNLSDEEILDLHPDYTVLDEFHRAGAEMWGQGVQKLLKAYHDTPVLGLSATNIRYLDNQRDMADEIFEGNIASEMTLGEVIVRGILNPPKYIGSPNILNSDGSSYNSSTDSRVTKVGKIIRETSLDEVAQVINVLKGEMSIIGPRASGYDALASYKDDEKDKMLVRPGISGYTQAYYRNNLSVREKRLYDAWYAHNVSFALDVRIFFKTIITVLKRDNVYTNTTEIPNENKTESDKEMAGRK